MSIKNAISFPPSFSALSGPASPDANRQPLCFGQTPGVSTDVFEPQFAGKRLRGARSKSTALMLIGILLGGGTIANAALDAANADKPHISLPGGQGNSQTLEANLDQIAEYARQSAQLYVPPASGRTAPDAMLRQVFCDYLSGVSREVASFNNASGIYLQPGNISHCYPETVFDPTEFSNLMNRVYQTDGWHAIENNYEDALRIVFHDGSTNISAHDKKVLLAEARRAFDALEETGAHHGPSGGHGGSDSDLVGDTWETLRKSEIMLALLMASGALIGVGFAGRIVFGTADAVDSGIQSARQKRRVKKAGKN